MPSIRRLKEAEKLRQSAAKRKTLGRGIFLFAGERSAISKIALFSVHSRLDGKRLRRFNGR
jgi:hypothetical protein